MNTHARLLLLSIVLLPAVAIAGAGAAPGDVDLTFGNSLGAPGWSRVYAAGNGSERGVAFARASDGGYVTLDARDVGINGNVIGLMRFDNDGQIDVAFGNDGRVSKDAGLVDVVDMIIDNEGRIVVAGTTVGAGGARDFALLRFNPDGSDDATFDGDGMMSAGFELPDASDDIATALAQQSAAAGSRYIVSGSTAPLSGTAPSNPVLLGVLPTGQLDPVFGNTPAAGRSYLQFRDDRGGTATGVVITPDNWLVVLGWLDYSATDTDAVAMILAPAGLALGVPDPNAALALSIDVQIGGVRTFRDVATAGAMSGPDKVVLVGDAGGRMFATRLRIDINAGDILSIDESFEGSGPGDEEHVFVSTTKGAHAADVALDLHGNLIIAGSVGDPGDGAVQRVHFNGVLPHGGGLRTYRAPTTSGGLAFGTEFRRITLDAGRPMLLGSAGDSSTQVHDVDGMLTRLSPMAFLDYVFATSFE